MSPLSPDVPALAVFTVKLPELVSVPEPDNIDTDPPSPVPPLPPVTLVDPPAALPAPAIKLVAPPLPPVDDPDGNVVAPPVLEAV